jgi:hypothetical protein
LRKMIAFCLAMMIATSIMGGTKDSGTTVLKDFQPAGTTDKHHKNQQYDLLFASPAGKEYTCRTSEKTSVKATDFVVSSNLTYKINDNKAKVKTSSGKELSCTIVRVANATDPSSK